MENPVLNRILLVVSLLGILFFTVYGLYSFTDFWLEWLPSQPKKYALELDHQISLPPKVNQDNATLEDLTKEYLQNYKIKGADGRIRIFDLRPEEEYFIGHIQHASLTTYSALESIATEGLLADKTVVILTNSGQDERLTNLVKYIEDTGTGKVYLEANFDPKQISAELIEVVLNPPSPL